MCSSDLIRGVRRGSEAHAVRCLRWLGERGRRGDVEPALASPSPAVRRAAVGALGTLGDPAALPALKRQRERNEEGRLAVAVARARCGDEQAPLLAELASFDARTLHTPTGPRQPGAMSGRPPLVERFALALGDTRARLLVERRAAFDADPGAAMALAVLGHPDDRARIEARLTGAGRRGEHALLAALAVHGDPGVFGLLVERLRATDVDPGRGFAFRRVAAAGLGQLGLAEATPVLLRALDDEVHDYEGRPGAGLGVQYPVRGVILWALGEIGDSRAIPALIRHLGDTHGSALGGFHLPAMDALVKLGPRVLPAVREVRARGDESAATSAVGVLAALGESVRVEDGDRPAVRKMVEALR